ncbi:NADH/ubiquinone/plastoquinone (complex I) [bacterium]|nr:NADH/ubiquinone/plastoquinone (complex I) [bacterium]
MNSGNLLPLFIAVPLGAGFLIPLAVRLKNWLGGFLALVTTGFLLVFSFSRLGADTAVYTMGGWRPPFGINLVGDGLSGFFQIMINVVAFLVTLYSVGYMKRYTAQGKYYSLLMLMTAGMNGVVATGDLFNMYVFLEISAISSYALVAFGIEHEELEASFKYLVLGSVASSFILFGIALLYSITGTLNMADIARVLDTQGSGLMVKFIAALFIMGFGVKASLIPFHAWLPDAHPSAPAPISAMLSGLLIKALGVYCILRIFFNIIDIGNSFSNVLIILGVVSMTGGALLAIGQWDFKRMLAYSSISQIGYIMFAFGLGTPLGMIGGLFHLLNHAFFKSLLFLCSGAVEYSTGTRDLRELGGLWKKMPVTSAACSIGALSISGIPPFGGFFSKIIIIIAAVDAAGKLGPIAYFLAAVTVIVSFLTLVYFVKLQKMALFGSIPEKLTHIREVPVSMWSALVILAVCCIAFGIACPWFISVFVEPAREILSDKSAYIMKVLEFM